MLQQLRFNQNACHKTLNLQDIYSIYIIPLYIVRFANSSILPFCEFTSLEHFFKKVYLMVQSGTGETHSRHHLSVYLAGFPPSIWLCTVTLWKSALKWESACYCTCSVPVMLSGAHFRELFVVCQFLTARDRSEAISLNLQFKLGPLQPDYKSTFRALRSSLWWMVDISNHFAVNPSVR